MGRFWKKVLTRGHGLAIVALILGLGACTVAGKSEPVTLTDVTAELGRRGLRGLPALDYLGLSRQTTVAELTELRATDFVEVEGYGLVIGLREKGSSAPPEPMRSELKKELARQGYDRDIIPDMLESLDTAWVRVWGRIPPAAPKGSSFDCFVEAGSPSVDLTGGYLLRANLYWGLTEAEGYVDVKATAQGPVGAGGFDYKAVHSGRGIVHQGVILGGGTVLDTRVLYLNLKEPNPKFALGLTLLINSRFSARAAVVSEQQIMLGVPPQYLDDWKRFTQVVDKRASWMLDEEGRYGMLDEIYKTLIHAEGDEVSEVALYLEAIGPPAADHLRAALRLPDREVRYQAAKVLAFSRDQSASEALYEFATTGTPARRVEATRLLGKTGGASSVPLLARLLASEIYQVRWEAMQALQALKDETYIRVDEMRHFQLLAVRGEIEQVILVNQRGLPKIMLFGENISVIPPATVEVRGGLVNLLFEKDGATAYFWQGKERKKLELSLRVRDIVKLLVTLNLNFYDIVQVLEDLSKAGALRAQVVSI
ncbi:MAG: hypothetical protein AMS15_00510 [Planctomycetes bacterium DG_23]|nr:MAG: hypothetical protein AMS15_00510 [Planctomycetes bacterium DG_23]